MANENLLHDVEDRFGTPVPIEEARNRWPELVRAVATGTITALVATDTGDIAALAPLDRLGDFDPTWEEVPLTPARAKLGTLVRQVAPLRASTVLLTRRGKGVVAALTSAERLLRGSTPLGLDADALLAQGHRITLSFRSDQSEDLREDPSGEYVATAYDEHGEIVCRGISPLGADAALHRLGDVASPARLLGETVEVSLVCQHTDGGPAWVIWENDGPTEDRVPWHKGDDVDAALKRLADYQLLPPGSRFLIRQPSDEPWLLADYPSRYTVRITPKDH